MSGFISIFAPVNIKSVMSRVLSVIPFAMCMSCLLAAQPIHAQSDAAGHDLATPALSADRRMDAVTGTLDAAAAGTLRLSIDNISFFKDNEFEGEQSKGYSLPGFWVQPRLTYQPLENVLLEAGFHALVYDGANKYPCYAYHDIGRWKGNQYQRGAHVLPLLRAQARVGCVDFVLGNIHGGERHGVLRPLWNPELTLTQDPEAGFQLLVNRPRWKMDAWLNWQSYIFEEDTHQEAFTVGITQCITLNSKLSSLNWYIPVNILVQHRGGEQDNTDMGVQTITNGAVGVGMTWNAAGRLLRSLTVETAVLGCWQQSGKMWPFDAGVAGMAQVDAQLAGGFRLFGGLFYARDFVSLYGAPFYSTLSQKEAGAHFAHLLTPNIGTEWRYSFSADYELGVKVDVYPLSAGRLTHADGRVDAATFANNFSFGVCLRCSPSFLLKTFNR